MLIVGTVPVMQDAAELTIGFLGAGKMATALARGFLRAGIVSADRITASDIDPQARGAFSEATGARTCAGNAEAARDADAVIVAVKPDRVAAVLTEAGPAITVRQLVVSIAAGVPLQALEQALCPGARVVRVMPNTPALVGASASAFSAGRSTRSGDIDLIRRLFGAVGQVFEVKEPLLDAVTGLSGSGPAYACLVIEALSDGGVAAGLPRDISTRLAAQTLLGTARMVLESGLHPAALKDMVTSPGGTTIEGLQRLEKAGVRGALIDAVRAAADRARQLADARSEYKRG